MNQDTIQGVLEHMGHPSRVLNSTKVEDGELSDTINVLTPCILAPWRDAHGGGIDAHPSMSVRAQDGRSAFQCWTCHTKGMDFMNAVLEWADRKGWPEGWPDRVDELEKAEKAGTVANITNLLSSVKSRRTTTVSKPSILDPTPAYPETELEAFIDRPEAVSRWTADREGRGEGRVISEAILKEYEVMLDPKHDRAVFPFRRRRDGALVGIQGRDLTNQHAQKWYNYWNFMKGLYLYGEHRITDGDKVVVVEGVMDVLPNVEILRKLGFSIVSAQGSTLSEVQAEKLCQMASAVYAWGDGDKSGSDFMTSVSLRIDGRVPVFHIPISLGMDPGSLEESMVDCVLQKSRRAAAKPRH